MTIRVRVDPTNPGQFFACCGILELADRLWGGAEGWFEHGHFTVDAGAAGLPELLTSYKGLVADGLRECDDVDPGEDDEEGDDTEPLVVPLPAPLRLDWWTDKSLKTWAGSMKARVVFGAMTHAIDASCADPLNDARVVFESKPGGKKGKKREPFYFDARRGANAHPLDVGFAPDPLKMTALAFPAVESLCLVGLQRFRPAPVGTPRVFRYFTWEQPMPVALAAVAACGVLAGCARIAYSFENAFRTDQKKHKGYLPATVTEGGTRR
jgi:CRISPR-associated protein Csb3